MGRGGGEGGAGGRGGEGDGGRGGQGRGGVGGRMGECEQEPAASLGGWHVSVKTVTLAHNDAVIEL